MENQLTIRLPSDLSGKIKERARRLRLKRSDVVRLALTEFFEGPDESSPLYEKIQHLVGSVSTGIPDLGERHREHLIQKMKQRG